MQMGEPYRTFETRQPWVVYTYLHHDWWTRVFGRTEIAAVCAICGEREVIKIRMPRFGPIEDRGPHPLRTAFLSRHEHRLQQTAPETWDKPSLNPEAHDDTLDILRDVASRAARSAAPGRATPREEKENG